MPIAGLVPFFICRVGDAPLIRHGQLQAQNDRSKHSTISFSSSNKHQPIAFEDKHINFPELEISLERSLQAQSDKRMTSAVSDDEASEHILWRKELTSSSFNLVTNHGITCSDNFKGMAHMLLNISSYCFSKEKCNLARGKTLASSL